jgi:hypothetical protein
LVTTAKNLKRITNLAITEKIKTEANLKASRIKTLKGNAKIISNLCKRMILATHNF